MLPYWHKSHSFFFVFQLKFYYFFLRLLCFFLATELYDLSQNELSGSPGLPLKKLIIEILVEKKLDKILILFKDSNINDQIQLNFCIWSVISISLSFLCFLTLEWPWRIENTAGQIDKACKQEVGLGLGDTQGFH